MLLLRSSCRVSGVSDPYRLWGDWKTSNRCSVPLPRQTEVASPASTNEVTLTGYSCDGLALFPPLQA